MRGETMYKILDFLDDRSLDMGDFLKVFVKSGYGISLNKFHRKIKTEEIKRNNYLALRERRRFLQKYLYKLKSDGLIERNKSNQLLISVKGKERRKLLRRDKLLDKNNFHKEVGSEFIIVSYDLPNRFNRERDKLREVLVALGFKRVHKSVWVGKVKLPLSFIKGLERLGILKFIEILEVTKKGTLKELV